MTGPKNQLFMIGGNIPSSDKVYKILTGNDSGFQFIVKPNIKQKRVYHSLCWFG